MPKKKTPLIVIKDTFNLKRGTVVENYTISKEGVVTEQNDFISRKNFIVLTEKLSSEDERQVKDIIKQQLRALLWNLYTKQNMLVQS